MSLLQETFLVSTKDLLNLRQRHDDLETNVTTALKKELRAVRDAQIKESKSHMERVIDHLILSHDRCS